MDSKTFLAELDRERQEHLDKIDALRDPACAVASAEEVVRRLRLALRQELEAAELAALWMPSTPQIDIKLSLGRMCGDETKHYRLIAGRLRALGEDVSQHDPQAQGRTKFFDFLAAIEDPVERVAAAGFTREAIGHLRNEQFIAYCESAGDAETARLYREEIQPDEWAHAELGRALLKKYATSAETQERARAVAVKVLTLAEGAVEALIKGQKMSSAPGC